MEPCRNRDERAEPVEQHRRAVGRGQVSQMPRQPSNANAVHVGGVVDRTVRVTELDRLSQRPARAALTVRLRVCRGVLRARRACEFPASGKRAVGGVSADQAVGADDTRVADVDTSSRSGRRPPGSRSGKIAAPARTQIGRAARGPVAAARCAGDPDEPPAGRRAGVARAVPTRRSAP